VQRRQLDFGGLVENAKDWRNRCTCRENGCTFMLGRWMYIHVGNMDVHSCRENVCKKKRNAMLKYMT
jgi:hypothetical protein